FTASAAPPCACSNAMILSDCAETFTRDPKPLAKLVKPSQRVSAKACCALNAALAESCGGAANTSSNVVPPTAPAPVSGSREGAVEKPMSLRLVGLPCETLVGAAPPAGETAPLVAVRKPSFEEMAITIW